MEYYITYPAMVAAVSFVLRTIIIERGKNNRFKLYHKIYPNESFDKLIEYEEKSKVKFYSRKDEK
jgi:hypothetical protein